MIHYFLEVSISWILLYSFYFFFLRKETFFTINRVYLMCSIIMGLSFPLMRHLSTVPIKTQSVFIQQSVEMINVSTVQAVEMIQTSAPSTSFGLMDFFFALYLIGVLLALIKMGKGLFNIYQLYRKGEKRHIGDHLVVDIPNGTLPFSFLNCIFLSKAFHESDDFNEIYQHELTHVDHRHTIDVLIIELIAAFFWWNPIIYMFRTAVKQTHEYIADHFASLFIDKKNYGHILLRGSSSGIELTLSNQFFNSLLKKRINMLFQEKSAKYNLSKYLMILPFLIFLAILFSSNINVDHNHKATKERLQIEIDELLTEERFSLDPQSVPVSTMLGIKEITKRTPVFPVYNYLMAQEENEPYKEFIQNAFIKKGKEYGSLLQFTDGPESNCLSRTPMHGHLEVVLNGQSTNEMISGVRYTFTITNHNVEGMSNIRLLSPISAEYELTNCNSRHTTAQFVAFSESKKDQEIELLFTNGKVKVHKIYILKPTPKTTKENLSSDKIQSRIQPILKDLENDEKTINPEKELTLKDMNEALMVVDGKILEDKNYEEYFTLDRIENVIVLKGDEAIKKYGQEGINGVIEIIIKKE